MTIQEVLDDLQNKRISKTNALQKIKQLKQASELSNDNVSPKETIEYNNVLFTRKFHYNEPFLRAHIVFGKQVILGVTNCSIALEALKDSYRSSSGVTHLHKVIFHKPVIVEKGSATISVMLEKEQGVTRFVNRVESAVEKAFTTISGEVLLDDMPDMETFNFDSLKENSERYISQARIENSVLLKRTKELKTVKEVYVHRNNSAGSIILSDDVLQATEPYYVHPAVLDSGFIIGAASLDDSVLCSQEGEGMWIPFMIKDIYVKGKLARENICKAQLVRHTKDLLVFDFEVYDQEGNAVVVVKEFTFKFSLRTKMITEDKIDTKGISEQIKVYLTKLMAKELKTEETGIGRNCNFMEMGIESNSLVKLASKLEEELGVELFPTIFFEYLTISELAKFLEREFPDKMQKVFHTETVIENVVEENNIKEKRTEESLEEDVRDDIAIIGMAAKMPMADTLDEFWENLKNNRDMITEIPKDHWDVEEWFDEDPSVPNKTYSKWGSFIEVDKFDPLFFGITPREAEWMDPQLRILLEKMQDCIEDAGYGKRIKGSNTGLFLAMSFHEYWDEIMREHTPIVDYQAVNSVASALVGRVSFIYDLHGISIPIDNACASSLTALHLAKNSILSGECDMAFVAGVNLLLSPIHYVFTSKARALSPTGHCYAFDKKANGYVPGEGVTVILLKPLRKAIADGDNIHAIIKGSAVNHVGRANNPTSPRPELQIKMLKDAWKDANVEPETISYIETHGTGTKLGDPIEINALKTAFGEIKDRKQYCALGSIKAHIGHLEATAGLAGVIKTILEMKHKKIPAMPYFEEMNPLISLEESPFFINQSLFDWEPIDGMPRRAGISSFGMAGHNAHVILEEYKKPEAAIYQEKEYLFVLSTKNRERLEDYAKSYLDYIEKQEEEAELYSMTYTLQTGREEMEERLAVLCKDEKDLVEKLNAFLQKEDDYAGIYCGRVELAKLDMEECLSSGMEILLENRELDCIAKEWVKGAYVEWDRLYIDHKPSIISLPTYPFAEEHYWRSKGLDYKKQENKKCTALHPFIDMNISSFEEQAFSKKFTDDDFCIQEHQVEGKKVLPGVAYLEMARKAVELSQSNSYVRRICNVVWLKTAVLEEEELTMYIHLYPDEHDVTFMFEGSNGEKYAQGKLELASNDMQRMETVINLEEIRQRCNNTRNGRESYEVFRKLGLVYGESYQVMQDIQYNEQESLVVLQLPKKRRESLSDYVLHPALMDGALQAVTGIQSKNEISTLYLPFSIGKLTITRQLPERCYVHASVSSETGNNKTFNIDITDEVGRVMVSIEDFLMREVSPLEQSSRDMHYFYKKAEQEYMLDRQKVSQKEKNLLVFANKTVQKIEAADLFGSVVIVSQGSSFYEHDKNYFEINPNCEQDYEKLYQALESKPDTILHMWSDGEDKAKKNLDIQLNQSLYSVFLCLRQFILSAQRKPCTFVYVYADEELPCYRAMEGFLESVHFEHAEVQWKMLGVEKALFQKDMDVLWKHIFLEVQEKEFVHKHIHYVNEKRMAQVLVPVESQKGKGFADSLRVNGVYMIVGGSGGLGKKLVKHMLSQKSVYLILMGRSVKPDWMKEYPQIDYFLGDVSKQTDVQRIVSEVKKKYGSIHGVVQCAGINRDGYLVEKEKETLEEVIKVKVFGTEYLDEATRQEPLDFFIAYSSLAGITGNIGQCDYAYANNFLNEFARERVKKKHPGKTLVINWPFWKDGGMSISEESEKLMVNTLGLKPIDEEKGMKLLEEIFCINEICCMPLVGDYNKFSKVLFDKKKDQKQKTAKTAKTVEIQEHQRNEKLAQLIEHAMIADVSSILKISEKDIDLYSEMNEFGFDSITFTEYSNLLNEKYGLNIIPSVFFEHTTLASFVEYIMEDYQKEFKAYFNLDNQNRKEVIEEIEVETKAEATESIIKRTKPLKKKAISILQDISAVSKITVQEQNFWEAQNEVSSQEDIAIIGMSGVMPQSEDLDEFWNNLVCEKDMVTEIPKDRWDYKKFYGDPLKERNKTNVKWAGFMKEVDKFDPAFFGISPLEAELMDPQQRIFMETVWNTIEDAGYRAADLSDSNTGVFVGVGGLDYLELLRQDKTGIQAQSSTGISHCILPNRISFFFNFHGPSEPVNTACSSSLVAIHRAMESIKRGECDQAIAGGVNVIASPSTFISFSKAGMLSLDGKCKTFDKDANGYVRGEGSGAVMLKQLSKAEKDGDQIYAVIKGSAVNHGGRATSLTAPNTKAQAELIEKAWKQSKLDPSTVTYIECHGTGTSLGDPVEINGLKKAFSKLYQDAGREMVLHRCGIGSVKSNIGHLETAAGVASVMKVVLAMKHGQIPKTIHFRELNPYIDFSESPFYVVNETMDWSHIIDEQGVEIPRRAGISSFGFGGVNAHIVLEEYRTYKKESTEERKDASEQEEMILLSAKTKGQLKESSKRLKNYLLKKQVSLSDLAYTLQCGREVMQERLVILTSSVEELCRLLAQYCEDEKNDSKIITGNAKKNCDLYELICDGKEGDMFIKMILEQKHYSKLAKLWVLGVDINWNSIYEGTNIRRISLPNYPFLRQRYWVNEKDMEFERIYEVEETESSKEQVTDLAQLEEAEQEEVLEEGDIRKRAVEFLTALLRKGLKLRDDVIEEDTEFYEVGLDSIIVNQLNSKMKEVFPDISATIFFTYKSIEELADYLVKSYRQELIGLTSGQATKKAVSVNSKPEVKEQDAKAMEKRAEKDENMDIAIVGLNGRYPLSDNLDEYWDNLRNGRDCISEIPEDRWNYRQYYSGEDGKKKGMYCKWGGFLSDIDKFDPQFFHISPTEARFMDPQERLFIQASWSCVEDAGYTVKTLKNKYGEEGCPIGVFAGVTYNNYQLYVAEGENKDVMPVNSQIFSVANRVSYLMNFNGPSLSVDTACSSSLYAVHLACESIRRGECEAAIAGGVNLSVHLSKYITLCEGKFLASDGRCRTFGEGGDGYVPGEGVGAIMLKPLSKAEAEGDHIYGVIKASAVNHDGKTYGFSVPNPVAQTRVITTALEQAKMNPETISYVEAHGTGTSLGDPIEIQGLTEAYRKFTDKKQFCAIGSVKSNIGHAEAAAGISQITKVLLQMKYHTIAPSLLHSQHTNKNIDFDATPFYVAEKCQKWNPVIVEEGVEKILPRRAGISSFGVGGVNVHLILEEYIQEQKITEKTETEEIIISAVTQEALHRYARSYQSYFMELMKEDAPEKLSQIAYTMKYGRERMPYQIFFQASTVKECIDKIDEYIENGKYAKEDKKAVSLSPSDEQIKENRKVSLPTYPFEKDSYWIVDREKQDDMVIETVIHQEENLSENMVEVLKHTPLSEQYPVVLDDVRVLIGRVLGCNASKLPDVKKGFFDLGMDSILSAKLYTVIEENYGLELHSSAVFDYPTIEKFAQYILEEVSKENQIIEEIQEETEVKEGNFENIYYTKRWIHCPKDLSKEKVDKPEFVMVFDLGDESSYQLIEKLEREGCKYRRVLCGNAYKKSGDIYKINPSREEDYQVLLKDWIEEYGMPTHIIHSWSVKICDLDAGMQDEVFEKGIYSVLYFSKALVKEGVREQIRLLYVYSFQSEMNQPQYEGVSAFAKSVLYENPNITWSVLGIEMEASALKADAVWNELVKEEFKSTNIQYTKEGRFEKKNVELNLCVEHDMAIRDGGVYLITGGLGKLGQIFAKYLAKIANVTLILTGRKEKDKIIEKQIIEVEKTGCKVFYFSCDISNLESVEKLYQQVKAIVDNVNGIIHAAGLLRDSYLIKKTKLEMQQVMAPKIYGIMHLDQVFKNEKHDFFIAFSSLAAVEGSKGQCDYAYSNYFMEGYVDYRNALCNKLERMGRSIAINWPVWKEGGMTVDAEMGETMKRRIGLLPLETEDGTEMFAKALSNQYEQLGIVSADRKKLSRLMEIIPDETSEIEELSPEILNKNINDVINELEALLECELV